MKSVWRWSLLALFSAAIAGSHAVENEPGQFYLEMVAVPGAGYWVGKYEVTQKQYTEITGDNPSHFRDDRNPVDNVSWDDATMFCEKLTAREQAARRLPAGYAYTLPTDAQWDQFAVGTDLKDAVTSLAQPRAEPQPVGTMPANRLGLCDVVGNVWEWCQDWYNNDIRKKDSNRDLPAPLSDAEAAAQGPEETFKVLRGGAWDTSPADHFDLNSRLRYAPGMGNYRTGFRCVVGRRAPEISAQQ